MHATFKYIRPSSLEELFQAISLYGDDALIYGGGTDVLVLLRAGKLAAKALIDVKGIPDLQGISDAGDTISIGAACCFAEIEAHPLILRWAGSLGQAAGSVGSVQIRHKGTLAGNIQSASPAGDGLNAAWGLDATLRLISTKGRRSVSLSELVQAPRKTALRSGEVIARIDIPKQEWAYQRFFKVGRRNSMAISVVNGIVALKADPSGIITDARISLGAVAPTPLRVPEAEAELVGGRADEAAASRAGEIVGASVKPISDIRAGAGYRGYMAGLMVKRQIIAFGEAAEQ